MSLAEAAIQREVLETLRTEVLEGELARRRAIRSAGKCPYCDRELGSLPICKCPSQHKK